MIPSPVGAQGTVQLRDARRPPPLEAPPECELWRGQIAGNDPTAEATLQLCTRGDDVSGVFLWSSLESGWDRRSFVGQWRDGRRRLTMHDTAMLANHPANGWRLCLADRYDLQRVDDATLTGEFWSRDCADHGTIRITRISVTPAPPDVTPEPALATPAPRRDPSPGRRRLLGCTATPGSAATPWGALLALAAISRSRGWRARR